MQVDMLEWFLFYFKVATLKYIINASRHARVIYKQEFCVYIENTSKHARGCFVFMFKVIILKCIINARMHDQVFFVLFLIRILYQNVL